MDINVYDDVANFDLGEEIEKLKTENRLLDERIASLEAENEELRNRIAMIEKERDCAANNISSLLLTAHAERDRKDRMIADLRAQLDNMFFRRHNSRFKRKEPEDSNVNVEGKEAKKFKSVSEEGEVVKPSVGFLRDETPNRTDKSRSTSVESRFDRFKDIRGIEERVKNEYDGTNNLHNKDNTNWEAFNRDNSDYKNREGMRFNEDRREEDFRGFDRRKRENGEYRRFTEDQRGEDGQFRGVDRRQWGDGEYRRDDERDRRFYDSERDEERKYGDNNHRSYNFNNRWDRGRDGQFDDRRRWTNERNRYNDRCRYENKDFEWNYSRHEERIHFERHQYGRPNTPPFPPIEKGEYRNRFQYRRMMQERGYKENHAKEIDTHQSRHPESAEDKVADSSRSVSRASLTENENLSKSKPVKKKLKMLEAMEEKIKKKRSSLMSNQSDSMNESLKNILPDLGNDSQSDVWTEVCSDGVFNGVTETHKNSPKIKILEKVGANFRKTQQEKTLKNSTKDIKIETRYLKELHSSEVKKDNLESKFSTKNIKSEHDAIQIRNKLNHSEKIENVTKETVETKALKKGNKKKISNSTFDLEEFAESILFSVPHKLGSGDTELLKDDKQDVHLEKKPSKDIGGMVTDVTVQEAHLEEGNIKKDVNRITDQTIKKMKRNGKEDTVSGKTVKLDSHKLKNIDKEKLSSKQLLEPKKETFTDKIEKTINKISSVNDNKKPVEESKISPKSITAARKLTAKKNLVKKAKLKNDICNTTDSSVESENSTVCSLKVSIKHTKLSAEMEKTESNKTKLENNLCFNKISDTKTEMKLPSPKGDKKDEIKENQNSSNTQLQDSTVRSKPPIKLRRSLVNNMKKDSNKEVAKVAPQKSSSNKDKGDKKEEKSKIILKDRSKSPMQVTSKDENEIKKESDTAERSIKGIRRNRKASKDSLDIKVEKLFGESANKVDVIDTNKEGPIKTQMKGLALKKEFIGNKKIHKIAENKDESKMTQDSREKVQEAKLNATSDNDKDNITQSKQILPTIKLHNDEKVKSSHVDNGNEVGKKKGVNEFDKTMNENNILELDIASKNIQIEKSVANTQTEAEFKSVSVEKENDYMEQTKESSVKTGGIVCIEKLAQTTNIGNDEKSKESVNSELLKQYLNASKEEEQNVSKLNTNEDVLNKIVDGNKEIVADVLELKTENVVKTASKDSEQKVEEESLPKECSLKENRAIKNEKINKADIVSQRKDLSLINKQVESESQSLPKSFVDATKSSKESRKEFKKKSEDIQTTKPTTACKDVKVDHRPAKITGDDSDSSSGKEDIQSKQKNKGMESIYKKFDTLIENHLKMSDEKNSIATEDKKSDKDETKLNNVTDVSVSKTVVEIQAESSDSNKSKSILSTKVSSIKTVDNSTPEKTITRRRITPTPVKDNKPICSFANILEKAAKPSLISSSNSPLHLTHEGEIPVLHLEENHINNLPTECNINDKNILNLLDSMNLSNIEGDMTKFKNIPTETKSNSHDFSMNVSPIKGSNLTFENVIKTVTSTPLNQPDDECKEVKTVEDVKKTENTDVLNKVAEKKVVTSRPSLAMPIRRRRRCRLIIMD